MTRIGTGVADMIRSMASRPPSTGMLMSIATISGLSERVCSMACSPFSASPTTEISGSEPRMSVSISRTIRLSSAISTRIPVMALPC